MPSSGVRVTATPDWRRPLRAASGTASSTPWAWDGRHACIRRVSQPHPTLRLHRLPLSNLPRKLRASQKDSSWG